MTEQPSVTVTLEPGAPLPPPQGCALCGGAWTPSDYRGVLTFRHRNTCPIDGAELQTQLADEQRRYGHDERWARDRDTRPATDTERALLAWIGYPARTPTTPYPPRPDDGASAATFFAWREACHRANGTGTLTNVDWSHGLRRRTFTFPNQAVPAHLPDPT